MRFRWKDEIMIKWWSDSRNLAIFRDNLMPKGKN
jgi:hypothetical protein